MFKRIFLISFWFTSYADRSGTPVWGINKLFQFLIDWGHHVVRSLSFLRNNHMLCARSYEFVVSSTAPSPVEASKAIIVVHMSIFMLHAGRMLIKDNSSFLCATMHRMILIEINSMGADLNLIPLETWKPCRVAKLGLTSKERHNNLPIHYFHSV